MAYLGTLEAIRARLEGNDPLFVPPLPEIPPDFDSTVPSREAGINTPALVDAFLRQDRFAKVAQTKVPIYLFDIEGGRFDRIYPSFTFEILDAIPRYDEFIFQSDSYQGDRYQIPVHNSLKDISIDGIDQGLQPRMVRTRDVEHPLDIMIEIRAYAKDPLLSAMQVQHIYNILPPRGFLRVPMQDGSFRSWDMLFEHYRDLDKREAVRSGTPGVEREYAKVWTYRVEGYFDNTDTTVLQNVINKRSLNLEPMP